MDIKTLVDDSSVHVKEGGDLVDQTGIALDGISKEIMSVDEVLSRVASGSQSQISNLRELASSMTVINDLAGQNMSMADDTRSGAEEIASRSGTLAGMVCDFKQTVDAKNKSLAA